MNSHDRPSPPRLPTPAEKDEVWRYLCGEYAFEVQEEFFTDAGQLKAKIESAAIAVFDDYISDVPGYVGKVMLLVWPGGPNFRAAFIWEKIRSGDTQSYQLTRIP